MIVQHVHTFAGTLRWPRILASTALPFTVHALSSDCLALRDHLSVVCITAIYSSYDEMTVETRVLWE